MRVLIPSALTTTPMCVVSQVCLMQGEYEVMVRLYAGDVDRRELGCVQLRFDMKQRRRRRRRARKHVLTPAE